MSVSVANVGSAPAGSSTWSTSSPRFMRRLLRRPVAMVCCVYLVVVIAVAIIAPIALPWVKGQNAGNLLAVNQGPSLQHLLGTDTLGRDVLDRLLVGTQVTVLGVVEALVVVLLLGVPLGLAAGYLGGGPDRAVTWLADLTFSVPAIVIILVVLSVFPESMLAGMVAFGVLAAPGLMRVVRSATLPVREELYIQAAQVSGLSRPYILTRHVLPRISGAVIVQASLLAAVALGVQTGLAFLNLLVQSPAPSWGGMVADGTSVLLLHPWLIWPPGIAIALTMLALCLLGDAVRDATTEAWSPPGGLRASAGTARRQPENVTGAPAPVARISPLLSVENLSIVFSSRSGTARVVDDVSFDVNEGEAVGIVGESGCGKTVTTSAILGLLPGTGRIEEGYIRFFGQDLAGLSETELRKVRGREIALVSQEPMIGLDPAFRVGWQLQEAVRLHLQVGRTEARDRAIQLLASVHLPHPETVARRYPHELSGGMAQRVAIARALAGEPKLLIADEPTTALDVTVQAEILELLRELQASRKMAVLIVTHDWGVVADICHRVVVMYAGQVVERSELAEMFHAPLHPYTKALLSSNPHHAASTEMLPTIPGSVPQPGAWPPGCRFHPRCSYATPACAEGTIALEEPVPGRETRCIHYDLLAPR
jgi:peptide/nickel transport system permease protein